jgi:hypothetical protein
MTNLLGNSLRSRGKNRFFLATNLSSRPERSVVERSAVSAIDRTLESAILELLSRRGPGKTICPSEAARLLDPEGWEQLMESAREAARRLVAQGAIVITQRGKVVDPARAKGAIRLRRA